MPLLHFLARVFVSVVCGSDCQERYYFQAIGRAAGIRIHWLAILPTLPQSIQQLIIAGFWIPHYLFTRNDCLAGCNQRVAWATKQGDGLRYKQRQGPTKETLPPQPVYYSYA